MDPRYWKLPDAQSPAASATVAATAVVGGPGVAVGRSTQAASTAARGTIVQWRLIGHPLLGTCGAGAGAGANLWCHTMASRRGRGKQARARITPKGGRRRATPGRA